MTHQGLSAVPVQGLLTTARRVLAMVGLGGAVFGEGLLAEDITRMRSLRPARDDASNRNEEQQDSGHEDSGHEEEDPLVALPEASRELFGALLDEVAELGPDADGPTVARRLLEVGAYNVFGDRQKKDPDAPSRTHAPMAWNPAEQYLVRTRPDASVRESLPSDTVPPGLAPDADDEQVAVAASREELATVQDINGLPQVTRHRAGADPWWYGGGGPLVEDISQGRGLGDCYLLALFACVARHDPDLLRRILPPDAAVHLKGVLSSDTYAWLYAHWDERSTHALAYLWRDLGTREAPFYLPQAFQLSATFARDDGRLTGAQARVEPERETWKVRRQGAVRYVERVVEYRSVRWPALLEKAFAAFFGNYGKRGDGQALQGTAYAVLGEGARSAHQFLRLLYGPQIRAVDNVALDALRLAVVGEGPPDERGVAVKALQALLRMRSQGPDVLLMTTSTSDPYIIERLRAMLPEGKTHYSAAEALHRAMTAVMKTTEIGMQRADSSDEPEPEVDPETLIARKAAEREALQKAVDLMLGELTAELDVLAPARAAYLLRDLLVTLRVPSAPSGVDDTPQRFLYCDHEYALLQTHLVFEGGAPDLNDIGALETALMKRLDAARSTVTLYNPHGQNSPNVDPGAPGSEDTGLFTLPLERFLNVSYRLNYTTVTRR